MFGDLKRGNSSSLVMVFVFYSFPESKFTMLIPGTPMEATATVPAWYDIFWGDL